MQRQRGRFSAFPMQFAAFFFDLYVRELAISGGALYAHLFLPLHRCLLELGLLQPLLWRRGAWSRLRLVSAEYLEATSQLPSVPKVTEKWSSLQPVGVACSASSAHFRAFEHGSSENILGGARFNRLIPTTDMT